MNDEIKKRGRKKKEVIIPCEPILENEVVKKKRGRKKKWETTCFKSNYISDQEDKLTFEPCNDSSREDYSTNSLSFGNLFIKVHDKEKDEEFNISNFFTKSKKDCNIVVSSDEEDTCDIKIGVKKKLNQYNKGIDNNKCTNLSTHVRCYNCHHSFDNIPFYLPIDHCPTLNRYKLFGNFCSPNCVKSYSINTKSFTSKSYIVGQFYRVLFGQDFRIKCAPSIYTLKEYGGNKSIEEFRSNSYTNIRYTLNNVNTKIIQI